MRKPAFTLVELIFSIVIIAIVFTVVPKLLFVTTKTMELSIKEDGLFSGIALMGNIVRLPWDENTVVSQGKILHTGVMEPEKVCAQDINDTSLDRLGYRRGGFVGSRNCIGSAMAATPKASFGSGGAYGDVDDYDGYSTSTSSGRVQYNLDVDVNYVNANDFSAGLDPDEVKEIKVSVSSSGKTNLCASFLFYSANLGHIQINKRAW